MREADDASLAVSLSAGVRNNLSSLQSTTVQAQAIQNRLATGKRVNSAIDSPVNFFTAASLKSLLASAGFTPLSCSEQRGSYPGAAKGVVVAIARPGDAGDSRDGVRLARKQLAPTLAFRARRKLALR